MMKIRNVSNLKLGENGLPHIEMQIICMKPVKTGSFLFIPGLISSFKMLLKA